MNERQQSHIDYYLRRLEYWRKRKPAYSTARLLAARDADEAHPLRTERGRRRKSSSTCGGSSGDRTRSMRSEA